MVSLIVPFYLEKIQGGGVPHLHLFIELFSLFLKTVQRLLLKPFGHL